MLAEAEEILGEQNLRLLAACVATAAWGIRGHDWGGEVEAADGFMKSEGVARPDRMTGMYLPGQWAEGEPQNDAPQCSAQLLTRLLFGAEAISGNAMEFFARAQNNAGEIGMVWRIGIVLRFETDGGTVFECAADALR